MRDFDDIDFLMETWTSPEKRKRKKGSKKDKKGLKLKKNVNMKTQESIQKEKKKKTKFKEAMDARKEKKKQKKKKKVASDLQDAVMFTQKPEASKPTLNQRPKVDHMMPDSSKSTKRKKRVMLDLLPQSIHVKRLKHVSSTPTGEEDPVTVSDSCSQATAGQTQVQVNDTQCTSDDINSQDLFITQKTFRSSPASEPSSEDAKAFDVSPLTQKDKRQQIFVAEIEQFYDDKCLQDSHQTNAEGQREISFQTERESNSTPTQKKGPSPVVKKNTSLQRPPMCPPHTDTVTLFPPSTVSTSTQTENFFTSELCSYLHFCKKVKATVCFQDMKPLDLSLKHTVKKDFGSHLSGKTLEEKIADDQKGETKVDRDMNQSYLSEVKEVKKEHSSREETTPSPQSECEHKSANTTTSSEDSEAPCRTSKLDLTQIRGIQMRLNESFFFKTKGDALSPRPESPLMKLVQGTETKSKKGH